MKMKIIKLQMIKTRIRITMIKTLTPLICLETQALLMPKPLKRKRSKWNNNLKRTKKSGVMRLTKSLKR
jgi:hypothetical protein